MTPDQVIEAGCYILGEGGQRVNIPYVASPHCPFPRYFFEKALRLQPQFNRLIRCLVQEREYLKSVCSDVAEADKEFTGRLFRVFVECTDRSNMLFFVSRSDYMIDEPSGRLLQVELNTVSAASGCLADRLCKMAYSGDIVEKARVPDNNHMDNVASAFHTVHTEWLQMNSLTDAIVIFMIADAERNVGDQALLTAALELRGLVVVRATLSDPSFNLAPDGHLIYDSVHPVSIVYYRSGYAPSHYASEQCWLNRRAIEDSRAVKCPNVAVQLSGIKSVQQALTDGYFINKMSLDHSMHSVFSRQLSLVDDYESCVKAAQTGDYVLKPQREGGGNNIYGRENILKFMKSLEDGERAAYSLQKLITAPRRENVVAFRNRQPVCIQSAVSELGTYGVYYEAPLSLSSVYSDENVSINAEAGWLLRTKSATDMEGGLVAGFSFVDILKLN